MCQSSQKSRQQKSLWNYHRPRRIIPLMEKIKSLPQAVIVAQAAKKSGKKIGFITGCFDILHEGHIDLFRFAKKHVDFLVIALDSDEAIREGKPACRQGRGEGRPIHSQKQRARILSELESVDMVIPI